MNKVSIQKKCLECQSPFLAVGAAWNKLTCSSQCRRKLNRYSVASYQGKIPTGTVGAIAELEVASDLMKKGFSVYRAMSPASSHDLLILKEGKLLRVEVKTGYEINGKLSGSKVWEKIDTDILAIFLHSSREVIYKPELKDII